MSVVVDSRLHATLRARDVLADIERERSDAIALALADAEQAAAERLDELHTIRRAHDLLLAERNELRDRLADYETTNRLTADDLAAERAEVTRLRALVARRKGAQ